MARGFDAWFVNEIKANRVAWPEPGLPAPMKPVVTASAQ
jgi:hypothetical protein